MRINLGCDTMGDDIASVVKMPASQIDGRAVVDMMDTVTSEFVAKGYVTMGPNFAKGPSGDVVNINQIAMARLMQLNPVQKTEVILANDAGERSRYLLTDEEVAKANQTGVLPKNANVSARFENALSWMDGEPETETTTSAASPAVLVLAALAAYLAFK